MNRLRTPADLDFALASERTLVFKHSTRCPISAAAFAEYRAWTAAHPSAPTGWIDVIEDRELSGLLAQRTGVRHESPQALLVSRGRVLWHASHGAITRASLEAAQSEDGERRASSPR